MTFVKRPHQIIQPAWEIPAQKHAGMTDIILAGMRGIFLAGMTKKLSCRKLPWQLSGIL